MVKQVSPLLVYDDCTQALAWLKQVFEIVEVSHELATDGSLCRAEIYIGSTLIRLQQGTPSNGQEIYVHVDDVAKHFTKVQQVNIEMMQAIQAGQGNSQYFQIRDEGGAIWTVGNYQPHHVWLRDVRPDDLPIFFVYQLDPIANQMAAFTGKDPTDRAAFDAHWERILAREDTLNQTIVYNGQVVGNIASFEFDGQRDIGYWIGQQFWGKGIASTALRQFLEIETTRPIYARVAHDNDGSRRVLEKCGFSKDGEDSGFANARGAEIKEFIFKFE